jgi:hypothetical protein
MGGEDIHKPPSPREADDSDLPFLHIALPSWLVWLEQARMCPLAAIWRIGCPLLRRWSASCPGPQGREASSCWNGEEEEAIEGPMEKKTEAPAGENEERA